MLRGLKVGVDVEFVKTMLEGEGRREGLSPRRDHQPWVSLDHVSFARSTSIVKMRRVGRTLWTI